jgi:hypothetical protein
MYPHKKKSQGVKSGLLGGQHVSAMKVSISFVVTLYNVRQCQIAIWPRKPNGNSTLLFLGLLVNNAYIFDLSIIKDSTLSSTVLILGRYSFI